MSVPFKGLMIMDNDDSRTVTMAWMHRREDLMMNQVCEGTSKERGERFLRAFMDGVEADESSFKVGYGSGHDGDGDSPKLFGIVVANINDKPHAFTTKEARALATSIESTINKYPFEDSSIQDIAQNMIMALRVAADHADNLSPEEMTKDRKDLQ